MTSSAIAAMMPMSIDCIPRFAPVDCATISIGEIRGGEPSFSSQQVHSVGSIIYADVMPPVRGKAEGVVRTSYIRLGFAKPFFVPTSRAPRETAGLELLGEWLVVGDWWLVEASD